MSEQEKLQAAVRDLTAEVAGLRPERERADRLQRELEELEAEERSLKVYGMPLK